MDENVHNVSIVTSRRVLDLMFLSFLSSFVVLYKIIKIFMNQYLPKDLVIIKLCVGTYITLSFLYWTM